MLFFLRIKLRLLQQKKQSLRLGVLEKPVAFWKPFLLLLPSLLAVVLFTLIPFFLTIQLGFVTSKPNDPLVTTGFENFSVFVSLSNFKTAIRNTMVYTVLSVPLSLLISLLISSAIVHVVKRVIRDAWLSVFFLPYMTSAVAISAAFFYMFDTNNGLINTIIGQKIPWLNNDKPESWDALGAILINGIWGNLAFQILILTTAMLSVNKDLYKSASIDGSGKFRQFFSITLPSINRNLNFLITIGIIGSIKVFPLALFNNNDIGALSNNGSTLMLLIYSFTKQGNQSISDSAVASIIMFAVGILTTITLNVFIRLIIKSSLSLSDHRVNTKINRILERTAC